MELIYGIKDRPSLGKVILFALQQLLAIMAATIAVPAIVGNGLSASAALFGAGVGTFVYLLFTKSSSPVFLGSSFAFIGSMFSAFGGAASVTVGYWGLIIGAVMAGLVYVIIAIIVKCCGVKWIDRLMPPVIIGPTVSIIGLSLSANAVSDLMKTSVEGGSTYVALICGLITLAVTMMCSSYGKKIGRLIPFIIGILAGYLAASIFALIGYTTSNPALTVINYHALLEVKSFFAIPKFTFIAGGIEGLKGITPTYLLTIFAAYVPVAFVVFAEHLADHKNLSAIIGVDLLKTPGLTRTLLGDGIGTIVSTAFGGCPNTTYGESIGCVAITRNASTVSIWGCAILCILFSLISPLVAFLETIPNCVMGGVCVALYGFIAVSGFKMFQKVDLNINKNLFVASVIFITGVGGMVVKIGAVEIRTVACALILGILTNILLGGNKNPKKDESEN
ncbi:solute carrier family 23 protein [uncultured Treponema sp.]|uniref:uracil-xanthine permease family protein n=1 Tax=uncultured Treponema sp. TaxID=162155 RepID=UPI0025F7BC2E|nr:solute carrier family 23 protein [uncultured Treponema sp.]